MQKLLIFCLILLNVFFVFGAINFLNKTKIIGSGNVIKKNISLSSFKKIEIIAKGLADLNQSDEDSLCIEAEDNIIPHIESSIVDGELGIRPKSNTIIQTKCPIKYHINFKHLNSIKLNGKVNARIDKLKTDKLNIEIYGNSKIKANLEVDQLKVTAFGSSKLILNGESDKQDLEVYGSAKYNGINLKSNDIKIDAYGSSLIVLNAKKIIKGSLFGSSIILCKQDPVIELAKFGSAKIKKIKD